MVRCGVKSASMKRLKLLILTALLLSCGVSQAGEARVTDDQAIKALIGEALHDDKSLYSMACALNNRIAIMGDLKGVYGFKASTAHISPKLWQKASKQWFLALDGLDVTSGATHWLSDYDLAHCRPERMGWRFKMVETLYQGQTHFYKEV